MSIPTFINTKKAHLDKNGIWVANFQLTEDEKISKDAWDSIYNYQLQDLVDDKKDFEENKLADHLKYVENSYKFTKKSIYLEIGSGPAHIGEYLLKKYGCHFIGVDFNYQILLVLKKYFEKQKLKDFTLIYADINDMPIKNESIDYIYGGGVIEHFADTKHILVESKRILKKDGVSFNTVPAFNLWWLIRFYNNIPALPIIKNIFSFIHLKVFSAKILEKYYGYELSFTPNILRNLHTSAGFTKVKIGAFSFNPSLKKLSQPLLRQIYMKLNQNTLTCPVLYVQASK